VVQTEARFQRGCKVETAREIVPKVWEAKENVESLLVMARTKVAVSLLLGGVEEWVTWVTLVVKDRVKL
jgi:hypothetical protein